LRNARFLRFDSSPQGSYDFFIIVEEIMIHAANFHPGVYIEEHPNDTFAGLKGFKWERRSLPGQTIARREGSTAVKNHRLVHAAILENSVKHLDAWRYQVKGTCADQGTERKLRKSPYGNPEEVARVLRGIENRSIPYNSAERKDIMLLPEALEQNGMLHAVWNAFEEAVKAHEEWDIFEPHFKAVVKLCGEPSYKDRQ